MSMDANQFRKIIRQTLTKYDGRLHSFGAEELLLMTAAAESEFGKYIWQMGDGPARGFFQCEKPTYDDVVVMFLDPRKAVSHELARKLALSKFDDLVWDIELMILIARLLYKSIQKPLPDMTDVQGMAEYWKEFYNTKFGKGTVEHAMKKYLYYVKGIE